jgi:HSP20 family protein
MKDRKRKERKEHGGDEHEDELEDEHEGVYEDIFGLPRRRRGLDDPFFSDFDAEFERMRRYMDRMMQAAMRGGLARDGPNRPFIYGFSMRTGPDGRPVFQEFGNTRNVKRVTGPGQSACPAVGEGQEGPVRDQGGPEYGGREPLTDVIDCGETLAVTVELPGVERDDIELEISNDTLTIRVDTDERRYYKEVDLPEAVEEDTTKASYKNGVLDVTLRKKAPVKKRGKKVRID